VTAAGSRPWLLSLALHGLAAALIAAAFLLPAPPAPPPVRMHLIAAGAGKGQPKAAASSSGLSAPSRTAPSRPPEPAAPAWRASTPSLTGDVPVPAPVSLDELLGAAPAPETASAASVAPTAEAGWTSAGGEGYAPPPLPPPGLAPPQGARWALVLSIPGGGGFATHVEGLDSGHPELDRWLETYLRTVSFPSSLDGRDYQLKWTLRLDTGKPQ